MKNKKENKVEVIQDLTEKQEARLDYYFEKWKDIGLRAGPTTQVDRDRAEKAMIQIYIENDLKVPEFVWARSPNEAIGKLIELGDPNIKNNPLGEAGFGQHDANWLGFYDFFRSEMGLVDETKDLFNHMELAECCGWYWPYENICVMSEIPIFISLDAAGNLHNPNRSAIQYSDDFKIYLLNGIEVPEWAIMTPKNEIKPKKILGLTNTEQRMALMRHVGLEKFLDDLGAEKIHSMKHPKKGVKDYVLYYLNVENRKIGPYLYMQCPSSGREFLEGVGDADKYDMIDPTIKTCEDAMAWRMKKASNGLVTDLNLNNWEHRS